MVIGQVAPTGYKQARRIVENGVSAGEHISIRPIATTRAGFFPRYEQMGCRP